MTIGWSGDAVPASVDAGLGSQGGYTLTKVGPVVVRDLPSEQRFRPPALLVQHGVKSGLTVVIGGPMRPYGILGAHVDSPEGRRGIFSNLGKVRVGDTIDVTRKDGTTVTFSVDRVKAYPKAEFPTDLVYKGDFTRSEIRLVTCGGPVDSQNDYRDNVVVFGHLTRAT